MTEFDMMKTAFTRDYANEMNVWGNNDDDAGITLTVQKITFYFTKGKLDFVENEKYEDY